MAEQNKTSNITSPAAHRCFTSPARLTATDVGRRSSTSASASLQDSQIDILFAHPSARIVQFSTATPVDLRPKSVRGSLEEQAGASELLPWTSSLERTIAVGTLRICKSRSGVTILNCGHAMQPILPKSRCWCVDERSGKFVLQMRRPQYWRIELPTADSDDIELINRFRNVLDDVLQFEKNICPFERDFSVDLPETSERAITYRPWRPRDVAGNTNHSIRSKSLTQTADSQADLRDAEDLRPHQTLSIEKDPSAATSTARRYTEQPNVAAKRAAPLSDLANTSAMQPLVPDPNADLPTVPQTRFSLSPNSSSVLADINPTRPRSTSIESDVSDASSSHKSFQTVASWQSPTAALPPSPPHSNPTSPSRLSIPHSGVKTPVRAPVNHGETGLNSTWKRPRTWHAAESEIQPGPSLDGSSSGRFSSGESVNSVTVNGMDISEATGRGAATSDSSPITLQRIGCSSRSLRGFDGESPLKRALPPFSPTQSIPSPSKDKPRRLRTARHIPTAILQKTYEILLSPPSHLIGIMVELARTVRSGEWRSWIWNEGDETGSIVASDTDHEEFMNDDDYDVPMAINHNHVVNGPRSRKSSDDRWEVD